MDSDRVGVIGGDMVADQQITCGRQVSLPALCMLLAVALTACGGGYRPGPAPVVDRSIGQPRAAETERLTPPAAEQPPVRSDYYTVQRGDTLYAIAFQHELNYQDVARWNGIGPPYTIYPGQRLGMTPEAGGYTDLPESRVAANTAARPQASTRQPPAARRGTGDSPTITTIARPNISSSRPIGDNSNNQPPPASTQPRINTAPAQPAVTPDRPPAAGRTAAATGTRNSGGVEWLWPVAGGRVNRGFVDGENNRQGLDISGSPGQPVLAAASGTVVYSGPGLTGYAELIIIKHNDELLSAYGHNRRRLVQEGENVRAGQQIAEVGRSPRGEDELHFQVRRLGKPQDPRDYLPRQ